MQLAVSDLLAIVTSPYPVARSGHGYKAAPMALDPGQNPDPTRDILARTNPATVEIHEALDAIQDAQDFGAKLSEASQELDRTTAILRSGAPEQARLMTAKSILGISGS